MNETTKIPDFIESLAKENDGLLISTLEDIQAHYNYLPEEALREVSRRLAIPLRDIYGVATFYQSFSFTPKGKHIITVCLGTACHVRGGTRMVDIISNELGIGPGETTPDMLFTLETVNCLGACALGPIVVVDGEYHGNMNSSKVDALLKKLRAPEGLGK
jgi:NADH-quinone oxidoreductase subunit E